MVLVRRRPIGVVRWSIGMRLCWMRLWLRGMRLRLGWTIRMGLLCPSISGDSKTECRQKCYSKLESRAHFISTWVLP